MTNPTRAAPTKAHHTIVSVEVDGGFLDGLRAYISDGLNCIVGGRGNGKTTVIELIRYALDLMPDREQNPGRWRAIENLIKGNLGNGRVRLHIKTALGARYTIERPGGESPQVFDEKGNALSISLARDQIFSADIYSMNELEDVASTPELQRKLLDKFADEDARRLEREIATLIRDLEENAQGLARVERDVRRLGESAALAPGLEQKLKDLEAAAGPDSKKVAVAQAQRALRAREEATLENLRRDIRRALSEIEPVLASNAHRLASHLDPAVVDGPNRKVFAPVADQVRDLATLFEKATARLRERLEAVHGDLEGRRPALLDLHAKQEAEYRKLVVESEEERERSQDRARTHTRLVHVHAEKKELEGREKERAHLEAKRRELLGRLDERRSERFKLRKKVAAELTEKLRKLAGEENSLSPLIRVTVDQAQDRAEFKDFLATTLKGAGFKSSAVAAKLASRLTPLELSDLVTEGDVAAMVTRTDLDEDKARRVLEHLTAEGRRHAVETAALDDAPRIELFNGRYKDASELSPGQRCTTILPILLLESERPLLIDQPEQNLENKFIFRPVVKTIRTAKESRQLIFVTHNANIPVLGDAERVFVLNGDGHRAHVEAVGTVDEVKEQIEDILEGGAEAFLERKRRYGH